MDLTPHPPTRFDIRSFGAVGDGTTLNTRAIQAALDACAAAGGGVVEVPPGVYLSGTLWLRSHLELHLCHGATLKASPHREDYNPDNAFAQNRSTPLEKTSAGHFLLAVEVKNVAITGGGTIDGNEEAFRGPLFAGPLPEPVFESGEWRPGQMVYFCESSDVSVRNVRLINGPYWHLFLHGCQNVTVEGLYIHVDRRTRNGDGIGLDCCRNVTVSNCNVDTSDDCITVRASGHSLMASPALSENIAVTNCLFRSRTCAVRIGVGDGTIRNVVFSNIVARDVMSGIHFNGKYTPASPGVEIENIRFHQFSISGRVALHLTVGFEGVKAIRDLYFSHIHAVCDAPSYIGGAPGNPIRRLHFHHLHFRMRGGEANTPDALSPYARYAKAQSFSARALGMPHAVVMEWAESVDFHDLKLEWEELTGLWQQAFLCMESRDLSFRGVRVAPAPHPSRPAVFSFRETQEVAFEHCTALKGTEVFATFEGDCSWQAFGNDLSRAAEAFRDIS